jgi:geranylgeranyl pyrophosphate synthase
MTNSITNSVTELLTPNSNYSDILLHETDQLIKEFSNNLSTYSEPITSDDLKDVAFSEELEQMKNVGKCIRGGAFIDYVLAGFAQRIADGDTFSDASEYEQFFDQIKRIAASIELFQTAMLIHDDIIDEDETRRGNPTSWVKIGSQKAIILGDIILATATSAFSSSVIKLAEMDIIKISTLAILNDVWSRMNRDVLFGQVMDLNLADSELSQVVKTSEIEELFEYAFELGYLKTASYTTVAPYYLAQVIVHNCDLSNDDQDLKELQKKGLIFQLENDLAGLNRDQKNSNTSILQVLAHGQEQSPEEVLRLTKAAFIGGEQQ